MIIDLDRSEFTDLRLLLSIDADYGEVKRSWELAGLSAGHRSGSGFHYLALATFQKGGRRYRVDARLVASAEGGSSLTLYYALGDVRAKRTRRADLDKLGSMLDGLAAPCLVSCSAHADVHSDRFEAIVGLPLIRFNMPGQHFDEIRGVRLVKLRNAAESDSVVLDMYEEGEIHISAQSTYTATSSSDMASRALTRLAQLRDRAVTAVQPETERVT